MTEASSGADLLNNLAHEFSERFRRGERPSLSEYTDKYPELAKDIRELFPALVAMEQLGEPAGAGCLSPLSRVKAPTPMPQQLGEFRILAEVARGGMGIVYEAVQEPLGRHVALKVLPFQSLITGNHVEGFQREARAAANLHHTNIVPVFAVGEYQGIHYYAMQFIHGQSLDSVLRELRRLRRVKTNDKNELPDATRRDGSGADLSFSLATGLISGRFEGSKETRDKKEEERARPDKSRRTPTPQSTGVVPNNLGVASDIFHTLQHSTLSGQTHHQYFRTVARLGVQVAEALAYAHGQGVLHRDIKPSNLLLDTQGTVWVTDFGLAKAIDSADLTATGDIVGTLRYMAPERFKGQADNRSDVYGLGVTLYELLTLHPVHEERDRARLVEGILHEEPVRPRKLDPHVPRDLETIVLKAIAKEPEQRYGLAAELAEDLRRFLADRPVRARRVTLMERTWRWYRRNRTVASLLVLVLLSLSLAAAVFGIEAWHLDRARRAEARQRERAEEETQIAQAVRDFLEYELLDQADVRQQADALLRAGGASAEAKQNPTIRELLDRAAAELTTDRIETRFPEQPLVQAEILKTIGDSYRAVGEYRQAIAHLERARSLREAHLGADHRVALATLNDLALTYHNAGRLHEAISLFEQVRDKKEQLFNPDDPETLTTLNNLASTYHDAGRLPEAITLFQHVRQKREQLLAADHPDTLTTLNNLAAAYRSAGRLSDAIALYEEALVKKEEVLGAEHPGTLITLSNLAASYRYDGRLSEAIRLFEQVRPKMEEKFGPDHPLTLITISNLSLAYKDAGRLTEAISLCRQVLQIREQKLGPDHPDTWVAISNLALAYHFDGRVEQAIQLHEQVRQKQEAKLGADHPDTLASLDNLAAAYRDAGRPRDALTLFEQVAQMRERKLGPDHPETLATKDGLASAYRDAGRLSQAFALYDQIRPKFDIKLGPDHPFTLLMLANLALTYRDAGRLPEAIRLYEELRTRSQQKLGPCHQISLVTLGGLATAYRDVGRLTEAIPLFEQTHEMLEQKLGPDHRGTLGSLNNLALAYQDAGRLEEAVRLFEQLLPRQERKLTPDHPDTLTTLNNLARARWAAGQLDRSVPLFEDLLRRRRAKLGDDNPSTFTAAFNLGVNYRDAGRLDDAVQTFDEWLPRAQAHLQTAQQPLPFGRSAAAETYENAGRFDRSVPLWREVAQDDRRALSAASPRERGSALASLGSTLLKAREPAEAETVLQECLRIREKESPDAWTTFNARSLLGAALLDQNKFLEAEPLLLQGYEGLKERADKMPKAGKSNLPNALKRLVRLYDAWGKPETADQWRKKLPPDKP